MIKIVRSDCKTILIAHSAKHDPQPADNGFLLYTNEIVKDLYKDHIILHASELRVYTFDGAV